MTEIRWCRWLTLYVPQNGTLCSDDHSSPSFIISRQWDEHIIIKIDRHTQTSIIKQLLGSPGSHTIRKSHQEILTYGSAAWKHRKRTVCHMGQVLLRPALTNTIVLQETEYDTRRMTNYWLIKMRWLNLIYKRNTVTNKHPTGHLQMSVQLFWNQLLVASCVTIHRVTDLEGSMTGQSVLGAVVA